MYRRLADPKLFRRLPYRGIAVNDIIGDLHRPLFDIVFQGKKPYTLFLQCMQGAGAVVLEKGGTARLSAPRASFFQRNRSLKTPFACKYVSLTYMGYFYNYFIAV